MSGNFKTVLMILYYFPPCASGGTYRPLKFLRYLKEYNWRGVIIAPTECKYDSQDLSLLKEIPHFTEVIRVNPGIVSTLTYYLVRKFGYGWIYDKNIIPDRYVGFVTNAVDAAKERIKSGGIDLVFTSAPPYSIHIAGQDLTIETGIPWIADFRDPWTSCPFYKPASSRLDGKYKEIEKSYFRHAAGVISFPEFRAQIEREKYPDYASKISVIENGFDPGDFPDPPPATSSELFTISHIGAITQDRPVSIFLEALEEALKSRNDLRKKVRLNFYGDARPPTPQDIDRLQMKNFTEFHGYVPHRDACSAMAGSNMLFMVLPPVKGVEGIMPLRLFEYVHSKRPVFLISPDGEASEFLKRTNAGMWVKNENLKLIAQKLVEFIDTISEDNYVHNPNLGLLKPFERKTLTGELAKLFDRTVARGGMCG